MMGRIWQRTRAGVAGAVPFFIAAAGTAIVVGLVAVLVLVFDDRQTLRALAGEVEDQASAAHRAAQGATTAAQEAKAATEASRAVLSDRTALVADTVNHIQAALAAGLAAHDLNSHDDHEDLRRLLGVNAEPLPDRTPITAPPPATTRPPAAPTTSAPTSTTTAPATTTTTRAATTTTTCPKRGASDRCR